MNKDVIYIEPEDDITDIITKIEKSKEKIVALVPPKKAGVFRSVVNIKLIAKAGSSANKKVVLVTTDPSILKLAAATRLPVTKNLQSAPSVPEVDDIVETESEEEVIETTDKNGEKEVVLEEVETAEGDEGSEDVGAEEENVEEEDAKSGKKGKKKLGKAEKEKKPKKLSDNKVIAWCQKHKKLVIGGGIGLVVLILLLIWAFVIAPAATVTIDIRTTTSNFSENVSFTETLSEENADEGKFYLEQKKLETKQEKRFVATGSKNVGEKASGSVVVIAYFAARGSAKVDAGATFTLGDLTYVADNEVTLSWDGIPSKCENASETVETVFRCRISARVSVTASKPGTKYNIAASSTGWSTSASVVAYSDGAMEGGTDKMITVVQQSDIDEAVQGIKTENEKDGKDALFETIDEGAFIVEASFKQEVGDVVSTPAVGEEVKEGEQATLSVTTTNSVYVIDKTKVEEFITEKAKLAENYKIYSMNDPFVENFMKTDGVYVGKLKTSYVSGPKITENDVVETVRGKGLGSAYHDLKDAFSGISSITIDPSFPWVNTVPNDANRITVVMNIEE